MAASVLVRQSATPLQIVRGKTLRQAHDVQYVTTVGPFVRACSERYLISNPGAVSGRVHAGNLGHLAEILPASNAADPPAAPADHARRFATRKPSAPDPLDGCLTFCREWLIAPPGRE